MGGKSIEVAGRGAIIGEMALIDSSARSATVIAKDYCVLALVNQDQFLSLMEKIPCFALSVMKTLVTRLRNMDAIMSNGLGRIPSNFNGENLLKHQ